VSGASDSASLEEKKSLRIQAVLGILTLGLLVGAVYIMGFYGRVGVAKEQPIPFSHRVHAGDKQIGCFMCHPEAMISARAGVPPLETCMLCHARIAVAYPPIQDLRAHYFENRPVIWNRVNILPEFVYFNHSVHIHRLVDCGACHGNVPEMDRIALPQELIMGFCIDCHKKEKASHDCFTCHR